MMMSEDAHQDFVLIDGRISEAIIEPGYPRPLPSLCPTYQNKRQKLPDEKSFLPSNRMKPMKASRSLGASRNDDGWCTLKHFLKLKNVSTKKHLADSLRNIFPKETSRSTITHNKPMDRNTRPNPITVETQNTPKKTKGTLSPRKILV